MRLRKAETDALVALAEQQFENSEEFVTALAAELDRVRGERIYYFALVKIAGIPTVAGYYSTRGQAEKALQKIGGEVAYVVTGRTAEGWVEHMAAVDAPPAPKGDSALVAEDVAAFKAGWKGNKADRDKYVRSPGSW